MSSFTHRSAQFSASCDHWNARLIIFASCRVMFISYHTSISSSSSNRCPAHEYSSHYRPDRFSLLNDRLSRFRTAFYSGQRGLGICDGAWKIPQITTRYIVSVFGSPAYAYGKPTCLASLRIRVLVHVTGTSVLSCSESNDRCMTKGWLQLQYPPLHELSATGPMKPKGTMMHHG